jgi:hypothetical protein
MAMAILASSGRTGLAQGRNDRNRGQDHDSRSYRNRFDEHDRQITRGWYKEHRRRPPMGLRRQDRLPPSLDTQLRVGLVLARPLRARIYAAPADLVFQLPPAPYGYRYVVIGGRIVLIDSWYRVQDMIWLDLW